MVRACSSALVSSSWDPSLLVLIPVPVHFRLQAVCMTHVIPSGPVCYRKKGLLAITDANLFLGRIVAEYFPKIFGEDEKQPLDEQATATAFQTLTDEINHYFTVRIEKL